MSSDFKKARHTIVLSDIHMADAEPPHQRNPLWKRFKRPKHFVDRTFQDFLEYIQTEVRKMSPSDPAIELVLNGDVFDFDSVMGLPEKPVFHVSWLERRRGLSAEEAKSRFKMQIIIDAHHTWLKALREFIIQGHRVIFVIGNHDMELHWPSVQADIITKLNLPSELQNQVRFVEWFYISNQDTLIEHGNQYDSYCVCNNPINPLIKKGSKVSVRLPFGNLAGKYMTNGMGLMNPHVDSSFIKESLAEYVQFYFKYVFRVQPFLMWTWLWGAMMTLIQALAEGFLPAMTDPLTLDTRLDDIANRSNASARIVWSLRSLHAHPAVFNPFRILRELWLDRALIFLGILFLSFELFTLSNLFVHLSVYWMLVPLAFLMPMFVFYARNVHSEVAAAQRMIFEMMPLAARISHVKRVINGHTHRERRVILDGIEYLNTGTWSPAFEDVECTRPFGRKCFAWIRPKPVTQPLTEGATASSTTTSEQKPADPLPPASYERESCLYEWTGQGIVEIPLQVADSKATDKASSDNEKATKAS